MLDLYDWPTLNGEKVIQDPTTLSEAEKAGRASLLTNRRARPAPAGGRL